MSSTKVTVASLSADVANLTALVSKLLEAQTPAKVAAPKTPKTTAPKTPKTTAPKTIAPKTPAKVAPVVSVNPRGDTMIAWYAPALDDAFAPKFHAFLLENYSSKYVWLDDSGASHTFHKCPRVFRNPKTGVASMRIGRGYSATELRKIVPVVTA